MGQLCAVIGIGQTKYDTRRGDVSIAGLVREAAKRALQDAGLGWGDIDAVVIGKAPDMFEGIMMPELYLADALGAAGKPIIRVHTAGSVGGSTGIVAASLVQGGIHKRVLTVAFEKQSESNAMWALSPRIPFQPPMLAGAGGYFAPIIRSYIARSHAPEDVGCMVAVKDRLNALKNPYAHLQMPDITMDMVRQSPMLWEPIRYLETCPSSDGACAMVLCSQDLARKAPHRPAWVHATAMRSEPVMFAGRNQVDTQAGRDCAAALYKEAGITNPRKQIDVAEIYVPFSWFEPLWLENLGFAQPNEGWKLVVDGTTALDGDLPVNASGGVLSSNPIGASGLIRFAEAAMQVRGQAGEHQVDGAKIALGHAYGGGSQFYSMWIVGAEKPGEKRIVHSVAPGRKKSPVRKPAAKRTRVTPAKMGKKAAPSKKKSAAPKRAAAKKKTTRVSKKKPTRKTAATPKVKSKGRNALARRDPKSARSARRTARKSR